MQSLTGLQGQTNNFDRRIRQHRGELAGSARYTKMLHKTAGEWTPLYHVTGFQTLRAVLQYELATKRRKVPVSFVPGSAAASRRQKKAHTRGPRGKIRQLEYLMHLGKLNEEAHSPFRSNGISVRVFLKKHEYLRLADMTLEQFDLARHIQGVQFIFE